MPKNMKTKRQTLCEIRLDPRDDIVEKLKNAELSSSIMLSYRMVERMTNNFKKRLSPDEQEVFLRQFKEVEKDIVSSTLGKNSNTWKRIDHVLKFLTSGNEKLR
jgi:hypothetical protein